MGFLISVPQPSSTFQSFCCWILLLVDPSPSRLGIWKDVGWSSSNSQDWKKNTRMTSHFYTWNHVKNSLGHIHSDLATLKATLFLSLIAICHIFLWSYNMHLLPSQKNVAQVGWKCPNERDGASLNQNNLFVRNPSCPLLKEVSKILILSFSFEHFDFN